MENRAHQSFKIILAFILTFLLAACGQADRAEKVLPETTQTCDGAAIQSKYIVHFNSGAWDFVENSDREDFKENYVRPQIDEIAFIEYDQKISLAAVPAKTATHTNAPGAIQTTANGINNWGAESIGATAAWQKNYRGNNIIVAVIDSGVDVDHAQLTSQIAYNAGESGANQMNGLDDDNNGYVDDYAGYSFYDNTNNVSDTAGHGTHVAGVIAANHSDTEIQMGYTQGVAPQAKILPVKFIGDNGGSLSSAIRAIDYAVARGAKVINASWGGSGCSQSLRQKVSQAIASNVIFVAAAGNNGMNLDFRPEYPAAFNLPLQITVGAIRESLIMADYSNYSSSLVQIFAPGSQVVSTMPGNSYAALSGTSMAAPFVAAASAILLSAKPGATMQAVRSALLNSAAKDRDYINSSQGRLNLAKAIDALGL